MSQPRRAKQKERPLCTGRVFEAKHGTRLMVTSGAGSSGRGRSPFGGRVR